MYILVVLRYFIVVTAKNTLKTCTIFNKMHFQKNKDLLLSKKAKKRLLLHFYGSQKCRKKKNILSQTCHRKNCNNKILHIKPFSITFQPCFPVIVTVKKYNMNLLTKTQNNNM